MMGAAAKNGTTTVQVTGVVAPTFTNWELQKNDFTVAMRILEEMRQKVTLDEIKHTKKVLAAEDSIQE